MLYAFCFVDLARYSANDLPLLVMVRVIIFIPWLLRSYMRPERRKQLNLLSASMGVIGFPSRRCLRISSVCVMAVVILNALINMLLRGA